MIQVAYVLTSNGKDVYADMNLISLRSLRYSNPQAKIILACDTDTIQCLETCQHPILKEADQIISIETPNQSAGFRNRFIKTSLRQYISGDFLYLDADTVIRGDLTPIFIIQADFAAAPNHSGSGDPSEMPSDERENFELLNWKIPEQYYVNGGVLFFADTPEIHQFSQIWHQKWLASAAKRGSFRDQPSLNSAINDSKVNFVWLPHKFNAQIDVRPIHVKGAIIWHLYSSNGRITMRTTFDQYISLLQEGKNITFKQIQKLCQRYHPWSVENPVDYWVVQKLLSQPQFINSTCFERLWMSRHYQQATDIWLNENAKCFMKILSLLLRLKLKIISIKSKIT